MNRNNDVIELYLQLLSLYIIQKDYNNTDLMQELQHQNRDYLSKIIEQNNLILKILDERSEQNWKKK